MHSATLSSLLLSLIGLLIGTAGGCALTWKLAGDEESISFLFFGLLINLVLITSQFIFFPKAKNELRYQLLYIASFSLVIVWFVLCLFLPIFWMSSINVGAKVIIACIFFLVSIANVVFAANQLDEKWDREGAAVFLQLFKPHDRYVDWNKVIHSMNVSPIMFIPGIPQRWSPVVGVFVVVFMLIGLNLRNIYPVFSVFSWGIPCIIIASFFLQVSGYNVKQASKVDFIQKSKSITLRAVP